MYDSALSALQTVQAGEDLRAWQCVPQQITADYARTWPTARKAAAALQRLDLFQAYGGRAFIRPDDLAIHVHLPTYTKFIPGIKHAGCWVTVSPDRPQGETWALFKAAAVLEPVQKAWSGALQPFGGPTPLSASLLGGALGAGLGYAGGGALNAVLPQSQFDPRYAKRRQMLLTALGAGLGAAPGVGWGLESQKFPEGGWLKNFPFQKASAEEFIKCAFNDDGALFTPSIPVDAFNQTVWSDVLQPANPFGTKSQWGDNSQALQTPPHVAAAVSGALASAAAVKQAPLVSPWDVALAAAYGGATGLAGGVLLGKTLGALAGLRPESQQTLRQLGLWGGILSGVVGKVF